MHRLKSKDLLLDGKVSEKLEERIRKTLINGAQGMFRWVEMSLEALSRIKYAPDFKNFLGKLPVKLSDLYEIIHTQIDQTETYGRKVAIMTLTWLLCAQRLLRAEELLAAVHAVDVESTSESDEDDYSGEAGPTENDILRLCRNLVVLDSEQNTFRFAHQSVREYLLGRSEYTVMRQHALATERCLDVYLNQPSPGSSVLRSVKQNDILKDYAEVYWPVHYKYTGDCDFHETQEKVSRFLMEGLRTSHYYIQWALGIRSKYSHHYALSLHYDAFSLNQHLGLDLGNRLGHKLLFAISTPETHLSVSCAFGFPRFLKDYALSVTETNQRQKVGSDEYTFLLIAAREGHDQMIQFLLDQGADINAQSGGYGNALQVASSEGHNNAVQILLENEADVNTQGGIYGNALQAASAHNHCKVVQTLLDNEADVNTQGGLYGNALRAASAGGHEKVVQMLLNNEANVNAQDGYHYGNALQAALYQGHNKVVQMLLDNGADINAQDRFYGNALQAASARDHNKVVRMLLDNRADVNARDRLNNDALQAALSEGYNEVMQILLDSGAISDFRSGCSGGDLLAASYKRHKKRSAALAFDEP